MLIRQLDHGGATTCSVLTASPERKSEQIITGHDNDAAASTANSRRQMDHGGGSWITMAGPRQSLDLGRVWTTMAGPRRMDHGGWITAESGPRWPDHGDWTTAESGPQWPDHGGLITAESGPRWLDHGRVWTTVAGPRRFDHGSGSLTELRSTD